jgi:hypothetical protein
MYFVQFGLDTYTPSRHLMATEDAKALTVPLPRWPRLRRWTAKTSGRFLLCECLDFLDYAFPNALFLPFGVMLHVLAADRCAADTYKPIAGMN